jgi:hypothetical protein
MNCMGTRLTPSNLVLRHKHPNDADRAYRLLAAVVRDAKPFSCCYHRIITVSDEVRHMLSVGRGHLDSNGKVEQVSGFFVDLTQVISSPEPDLAVASGDERSQAYWQPRLAHS